MQKPKIQVSFRINNRLLEAVEKQRKISESPLSQVQYVVALISREYSFFKARVVEEKTPQDAYMKYRGHASTIPDEMFKRFGKIATKDTTRFQYRTEVTWLSNDNTYAINLSLFIGYLIETGELREKDNKWQLKH